MNCSFPNPVGHPSRHVILLKDWFDCNPKYVVRICFQNFPRNKARPKLVRKASKRRSLSNRSSMAHSLPGLSSPFLSSSSTSHPMLSTSLKFPKIHRRMPLSLYPRIRALEFDQDTVVAISVGVVSLALGIGIPVFYETQIDSAAKRENTQPCFPCNGSGAQQCRFCTGTGNVSVVLGGGETEVSKCINCDGAGSLTCTTCQGSGIQPRYLDRREFKDDD